MTVHRRGQRSAAGLTAPRSTAVDPSSAPVVWKSAGA